MSTIQLIFPREWTIKIPSVIRYLESQYVEEFFATGRLKLTTYPTCIAHENESRRDAKEGRSTFSFEDGDHVINGFQIVGSSSYMLCTSMIESEELMEKFRVDDYMTINDLAAFSDAVSRRVSGFVRGSMGACIYRPEKVIARNVSGRFDHTGESIWRAARGGDEKEVERAVREMQASQSAELSRQLDLDHFLLKENVFANEAEYRTIWNVPYQVSGPVIIECPEAIQFCTPRNPRAADAPKPPSPVQNSHGVFVMGLSSEGARRRLDAIDQATDGSSELQRVDEQKTDPG